VFVKEEQSFIPCVKLLEFRPCVCVMYKGVCVRLSRFVIQHIIGNKGLVRVPPAAELHILYYDHSESISVIHGRKLWRGRFRRDIKGRKSNGADEWMYIDDWWIWRELYMFNAPSVQNSSLLE